MFFYFSRLLGHISGCDAKVSQFFTVFSKYDQTCRGGRAWIAVESSGYLGKTMMKCLLVKLAMIFVKNNERAMEQPQLKF